MANSSMKHTGGCLCGAVRFSVEHVETHHHACHCGMCRRWSGGSAFFAAEVLLFEADQTYMLSVGAFDDPSAFRIFREIFIDRKPEGYAFVGDHERWTEAETFDRLTPP